MITSTNKPVVTVTEKTYEMVYKIKGTCNIGAWIEKKDIEAFGLAIAFDLKCDQLEKSDCHAALQTTREVRKALGL